VRGRLPQSDRIGLPLLDRPSEELVENAGRANSQSRLRARVTKITALSLVGFVEHGGRDNPKQ